MSYIVQIILPAFLLDCLIGDPRNPIHPIRIVGRMISGAVSGFQWFRIKNPLGQFAAGAMLTVMAVGLTWLAAQYAVEWFHGIRPWLGRLAEIVLCYFIIAPRSLRDESMNVYQALQTDDLPKAREKLARIVGRDTRRLERPGIVRAAVETVAENFSDGVIAPLFYVFIGGVPLGFAYKTVNTLDSMIGYRNEKYEYFGKFAARLDDAANYGPSRISALFLLAATWMTRLNAKRSFRIYRRDRRKHESPNSAQTESVCAGALGLQLGGDGFYDGRLVSKPTIGDPIVPPDARHIVAVNRLMYAATVIGILAMSLATILLQETWRYFHV